MRPSFLPLTLMGALILIFRCIRIVSEEIRAVADPTALQTKTLPPSVPGDHNRNLGISVV